MTIVSEEVYYRQELDNHKSFLSGEEPLIYSKHYTNTMHGVIVSHYGINLTSRNGTSIPQFIQKLFDSDQNEQNSEDLNSKYKTLDSKPLYPLEVLLIRKAIETLQATEAPTQAILVDIFVRHPKSAIKKETQKIETEGETVETARPEIHTLVLYMQQNAQTKKKQILIIDPNSSDFSKHIATNSLRIFLHETEVPMEILAPSTDIKIYTLPKKTRPGPGFEHFRGCTDIAVKLAFRLNQLHPELDFQTIEESEAINMIGNTTRFANTSFKLYQIPARVRQSSDLTLSNKTNLLFKNATEQSSFYIKLGILTDKSLISLAKLLDGGIESMLKSEQNYKNVPKNISDIINKSMERYKTFLTHITSADSEEQLSQDFSPDITPLWPIESDLTGSDPS